MTRANIPLPRLLDKNSLAFVRTIRPVSASVDLSITPLSTASLQLPEDEVLPARSYVEMFTAMGSAGIYRVRSPQNTYGGNDAGHSELEHAVTEVGDWLIKTEIKQQMAAGTAMSTVFNHYGGTKWQLGSTTALGTDSVSVSADYDIVLEAMLRILSQVPDCMMTFDFSTTPWTINFAKRDTTVSAEGRLSRNVRTAKISYDDSELCTRAYYECASTSSGNPAEFPVFDKTVIYSQGSYVSYNNQLYLLPVGHAAGLAWAQTTSSLVSDIPSTTWAYVDADTISTWGVIEREIPTGSDFTAAEALRVASDYVRKHRNPRISVEIDAQELSTITGEPLDTFTLGKMFRLVMPKHGITMEECITGLSWDDVYGAPYDISVFLASEQDSTVSFLHEVLETGGSTSAGGGGGGKGRKKKDDEWKEFETKIEKTEKELHLWAKQYKINGDILRQAGMFIDATGTIQYAQDNEKQVGARIKTQADRISLVVSGSGPNATIKAAEIWAGIDTTLRQSQVRISADIINLDGYVTATQLNTQKGRIDNLISGDSYFTQINAHAANLGSDVYIMGRKVHVYEVYDIGGTKRYFYGYT